MSVDIDQLRNAIAAPGIDPRYWVRLGKVTEVSTKDEEGNDLDYVELTIQEWPEGSLVRLPLLILGGQSGSTTVPIKADDMVLTVYPDGEGPVGFAVGPITVANTNQNILDNIQQYINNQFKDSKMTAHFKSIDITANDGVIVSVDSGNVVQLGSSDATDPVVMYNELADAWGKGIPTGKDLTTVINNIETELADLSNKEYKPTGIKSITNAKATKVEVE